MRAAALLRIGRLASVALLVSTLAAASAPADPIGGVIPDHASTRSSRDLAAPVAGAANVAYNGGPVMHTNRTHVIFWNPSNKGLSWDPGYQTVIDGFLANVAAASHSAASVYGLTGQYRDATGPAAYDSTFAGALQDTDSAPAANGCTLPATAPPWPVCLTTTQLRDELKAFVAANGLPSGLADIYFLVTPDGLGSCNASGCSLGGSIGAYCGFHSRFTNAAAQVVLWANIPYQAAPDHCHTNWPRPNSSAADPAVEVIAHEHIEAITDPLVNAWFNPPENEIADVCVGHVPQSLGGSAGSPPSYYNQIINGGHYFLEDEWSNEDARGSTDPLVGCKGSDEVDPVAFSVPVRLDPGQPIALHALASDPDGQIVGYSWDFGDGSVHMIGPSPSHAYPRDGTYTITLAALDSGGQIASTFRRVNVDELPTAKLVVRTKHPKARGAVSFSGTGSSDPDGSIRGYLWHFGDGSSKQGRNVTHTYRRPGHYTVSLIVVDGSSLLASTSKRITVAKAAQPHHRRHAGRR